MKLFDKAIKLSEPVKELAVGVMAVAEQLKNLASTVAIIAHNQAVHHQMIIKMWSTQQAIYKKMLENSLDTQMPDIEGKTAKADKPKPN